MVLLFSAAGFFAWFIFFMVLFWIVSLIAKGDKPKTDDSSEMNPAIFSFRVYEKPKVAWETPKDDEEKRKCSTSIPSNVEKLNLVITEGDNGLSVDIQSVVTRDSHSEIVFIDNVDEKNLYPVTIPPDAGEVTLIIKETDQKISVEVESVEKKEEHLGN